MTSVPTHHGGKGLPASSTASWEQQHRAGGLCCWNNDQPCLGFPARSGTAGREGRGEECVRFRHLRDLIKKTADSISSALQIPLLQEQQPWKTPSPVSSAWKIPKAAKAGVCGKGGLCLPGAQGSSGNSSGVETQQSQLGMTSSDSPALPAHCPSPPGTHSAV